MVQLHLKHKRPDVLTITSTNTALTDDRAIHLRQRMCELDMAYLIHLQILENIRAIIEHLPSGK